MRRLPDLSRWKRHLLPFGKPVSNPNRHDDRSLSLLRFVEPLQEYDNYYRVTAIFISDVHLQDSESLKTRLVVRFLDEVVSRFNKLYILGDLFDVWPGTDAYLARRFRSVLSSIKNLSENGCEVNYVEGNHDFCLGKFFRDSLGVEVHDQSCETTLGGRRIFMAHGDLGNPKEFGYRILRRALRAKPVQLTRSLVPGSWIYELGKRSSQVSRRYQGPINLSREQKTREIYRKTASEILKRGFDLVIMGHTHIPDDFRIQIGPSTKRYINLGDWVRNFTYLEFDGVDFYTKSHPIAASV